MSVEPGRPHHDVREADHGNAPETDPSAERLHRFASVAAGLSQALTYDAIGAAVVDRGVPALGASGGALAVARDADAVEVVRAVGYPPDVLERWRRFPVDAALPLAEAIRTREPVWITSVLDRDARYPVLADVASTSLSFAALPLVADGRAIGGIALSYSERHVFDPAEREFLVALAGQCAIALERVRLQEAERRARAQVADVLTTITDAFVTLDREWRFVYLNDMARRGVRELGKDPDTLIGRVLWEAFPELSASSVEVALRESAEGSFATTFEAYYAPLHEWLEFRAYPTDHGQSLIIRNITQAVGAARERRESDELLAMVTEQLPAVLWTTDRRLRFTSSAGAGLKGLELQAGELKGTTVKAFFGGSPEGRQALEAHRRALHGETLAYEIRWAGRAFEVHLEPLRAAGRKIVGVLGLAVDVTAQRGLEGQLLQAQKMEAIGRLAGGIAHDFNNLLTAILGYAELAANSVPPGDVAQGYLRNVKEAADRAASLTHQLLAFARRQMIEPRVVELNPLVEGFQDMLQRLIGPHIRIVLALDPGGGAVKVDPGQLEQVLMNLAANARDAMPDGGELVIETRGVGSEAIPEGAAAGAYMLLSVHDTGAGMTRDVKERLFEPFFTTKETGKGTGLGLSTCYGIVKQSGGYIWVDSEPAQGTTFRIYLPRVDGQPAEASRPAAPPPPRGTETILLVEDEALVRGISVQALRNHGYTVLEATNGAEGVRVFQNSLGAIDLVVTDVIMPQMGGRELADRLRAMRPGLRVLFTSGYTQGALSTRGRPDTGTAFLPKPFAAPDLLRKVREVLDEAVGSGQSAVDAD